MDKDLAVRLSEEIKIDIEQILQEWWEMVILREIFSSPIGNSLIFKGGTALRLAYGSPRFSEDLDFSRINNFSFESFRDTISLIEKRYSELDIRDVSDKFYTYIAQYRIREVWRPLAFSVKIEVSKRTVKKNDAGYELLNLKSQVSNIEALGNVMRIEDIYKEKLRAIETRDAPRDLFDIWYLSNVFRKPYKSPKKKFEKRILVRNLRKYLPKTYWNVIETLGGE